MQVSFFFAGDTKPDLGGARNVPLVQVARILAQDARSGITHLPLFFKTDRVRSVLATAEVDTEWR